MTRAAIARLKYENYREGFNLLCEWSPLDPMPAWEDVDERSKWVWREEAKKWMIAQRN